jgi:hypothetical protein
MVRKLAAALGIALALTYLLHSPPAFAGDQAPSKRNASFPPFSST